MHVNSEILTKNIRCFRMGVYSESKTRQAKISFEAEKADLENSKKFKHYDLNKFNI